MGCCAQTESGMPVKQKVAVAIATAEPVDPEADYPLRSGTYHIKHQDKNEYLYVGEPRFDDYKKHVLGWTCGEVDDSMKFIIKAHDDGAWYSIKVERWNALVQAADEMYTETKRHVLMPDVDLEDDEATLAIPSFRWIIKKVNDDWFEITGFEHGSNMYMGEPSLDSERRLPLMWEPKDCDSNDDPCQRWTFEKVE